MDIFSQWKDLCRQKECRIAFPEGNDNRILRAVYKIKSECIAEPVLVGNKKEILQKAKELNIDLSSIEIIDHLNTGSFHNYINDYIKTKKNKKISTKIAKRLISNPLYYAAYMTKYNIVDATVSGAINKTSNVLKAGIRILGTSKGNKTVSSFFVMNITHKPGVGKNGVLFYADAGVVPYPTSEQLADIAICTADNFKNLMKVEPKIAMLSFSTKGSAEHSSINKVRDALKIIKCRNPQLNVDGEIQADTALIPQISEMKNPASNIKGDANILIFPNLDAGNISYKLTERLADADAVGPIIQGLSRPFNDLSRGCSVDDIINVTIITVLQCLNNKEK